MSGPAVRASHLKSVISHVDRLAPALRASIKARLGPDAVRTIVEAAGPEWLPFQLELDTIHAMHGALGEPSFTRFYREHFRAEYDSPLFKAFREGTMALFGPQPGLWARTIPTGWGLVFRDVGSWRLGATRPGEVELLGEGFPSACSTDDGVWLDGVAAALSAMIDYANVPGAVERDRSAYPRRVRLLFRWQRADAARAS